VIKYFDEFSKLNVAITVILNVAIVFFGASLIIGAIKSNVELLATCFIYFLMEFVRCLIGSFEICNHNEEATEKLFILFDTGMDVILKINIYSMSFLFTGLLVAILIFSSSLIVLIKIQHNYKTISLIGRTVALNQEVNKTSRF
jgi:hypothetical protein